jgi:ATP-dependent DNA helicase RecG
VGVNVPNATLMIIENAERFGLAQLHQLRGRVGRSDLQSYCVLISDTKSTETKKKLKFLRDHDDGFELAEYDLKTRGPGQLFGLAQSGVPFFRLANLYEDKELLEITQTIVENTEIDASIDEQLELFYYKFEGNIGI